MVRTIRQVICKWLDHLEFLAMLAKLPKNAWIVKLRNENCPLAGGIPALQWCTTVGPELRYRCIDFTWSVQGSSGSNPQKPWYQIREMFENVKYVEIISDHHKPRQLCCEMRPLHLMRMDVLMVGLLLEMRFLGSRFATFRRFFVDKRLLLIKGGSTQVDGYINPPGMAISNGPIT